MPNNSI